jgi:hypothetical protein
MDRINNEHHIVPVQMTSEKDQIKSQTTNNFIQFYII